MFKASKELVVDIVFMKVILLRGLLSYNYVLQKPLLCTHHHNNVS